MTIPVRFAQPWWLVGLVVAVLPVLAAWAASRRGRRTPRASVVLQCLALAAVAVALAEPQARFGVGGPKAWLMLRDVSSSMRTQQDALRFPSGMVHETIDFAGAVGGQDTSQTNAAAALLSAAAMAERFAGVIIHTDGQFADDWSAAAATLGQTGAEVAVVAADAVPADARVSDFSAWRLADGRAELSVTVASNAGGARRLMVRRERPAAEVLLDRKLRLLPGDSTTIHLTDSPPASEAAVWRAMLDAGDAFVENDFARAAALPLRQRAVFVAPEGAYDASRLAAKLPFELHAVEPGDGPASAEAWSDYAAAVVVDPAGDLLAKSARAALAEYVRSGGGLVLVGSGPRGGLADRDDPLNRVAALVPNPFERRPMKLTIVLDASGSMAQPAGTDAGGTMKFDLASEAVLALRRHLTDRDALAVVAFSDRPQRVYDSGAARPDFAALGEALRGIRPSGPTEVGAALQAAPAPAPGGMEGLVIVVSDLRTAPFEAGQVAEAFRRNRLSLAVVAIEPEAKPVPSARPLEELARMLDAPLVRRGRLTHLAKVFATFLRRARGDAVRRGQFTPTPRGALFGRKDLSLPALDAYLLCGAAEGSDVVVLVDGDPVVARRLAGLGKSVSLAFPLDERGNAGLRRSARFDEVLAAALRWALRPAGAPGSAGRASWSAGTLHVRIDAEDSDGPRNGLELVGRVTALGEDASVQRLPLAQTAPGVYEGAAEMPAGPLAVVVHRRGGSVVWRGAVGGSYPREFATLGADWGNLRMLADLTGGRMVRASELADLAARHESKGFAPLWPVLLAAGAALMLIDWATARILRARA